MKYNFQLEFINTVLIIRDIHGCILNVSKDLSDSFYEMSLIAGNIYYDKTTHTYWKMNTRLIVIDDCEYIQEEYVEVTAFLVENKKLTTELKKDPLTKIGNVAAAEEKEKEIVSSGSPCVLVMCDVNDFKGINDTYGHTVGDKALQGIAKIFDDSKYRFGDCISRVGGDEFLLLFDTFDIDGILRKMNNLQEEIKKLGEKLGIPLSISVGISLFEGSNKLYNKKQEELCKKKKEADQALYYVKNNAPNKNNIAYFDSEAESFVLFSEYQPKIKKLN